MELVEIHCVAVEPRETSMYRDVVSVPSQKRKNEKDMTIAPTHIVAALTIIAVCASPPEADAFIASPLGSSLTYNPRYGSMIDSARVGNGCETPYCTTRKRATQDVLQSIGAVIFGTTSVIMMPSLASAANLPESTVADLSRTGSIETLTPILKMQRNLVNAKSHLVPTEASSSSLVPAEQCTLILQSLIANIPRDEKAFKRIFDSYSTPVSYKQKFLDQNAFLVYYTKGFDGPGRPSIESGDDATNSVQTMQYGARNDAWAGMDDLFVELEFGGSNKGKENGDGVSARDDLMELVNKVIISFDEYLSYAPESDVKEARSLLSPS